MTKLSDYETILRSTTRDHHKFFRRFHEDDDNDTFCLFAFQSLAFPPRQAIKPSIY